MKGCCDDIARTVCWWRWCFPPARTPPATGDIAADPGRGGAGRRGGDQGRGPGCRSREDARQGPCCGPRRSRSQASCDAEARPTRDLEAERPGQDRPQSRAGRPGVETKVPSRVWPSVKTLIDRKLETGVPRTNSAKAQQLRGPSPGGVIKGGRNWRRRSPSRSGLLQVAQMSLEQAREELSTGCGRTAAPRRPRSCTQTDRGGDQRGQNQAQEITLCWPSSVTRLSNTRGDITVGRSPSPDDMKGRIIGREVGRNIRAIEGPSASTSSSTTRRA